MEFIWNTKVLDQNKKVMFEEKDRSNLIMDQLAGNILHRFFEKWNSDEVVSKIKYIAFGDDSSSPNDSTLGVLGNETFRIVLTRTKLFNLSQSNEVTFEYIYENNTENSISIKERGLVMGGTETLGSGFLANRIVNSTAIVIPPHGIIQSNIKLKLKLF